MSDSCDCPADCEPQDFIYSANTLALDWEAECAKDDVYFAAIKNVNLRTDQVLTTPA